MATRRVEKIVGAVLLAAFWVVVVAFILYVTIPLGNISARHFDAILVLGCPARSDGTPSAEQRERVMEGVRQFQDGVAPVIIFSGGPAHNRFVEAEVMGRLAEQLGVPQRDVFEDKHARDTVENIEYSTLIMREHGWHSVETVSSVYHLRRASLILMHSPIRVNWRMQGAPWPRSYDIADKTKRYAHEIYYCAKMRLLGFREAIPPLPSPRTSDANSFSRNAK